MCSSGSNGSNETNCFQVLIKIVDPKKIAKFKG